HDSDHASSAQAAVQTGGALLSASRAAETIPAFVEVFARQRGEALAHHPRQRPTRADLYFSYLQHRIEVEQGAEELAIVVSDNSGAASGYGPSVIIDAPSGQEIFEFEEREQRYVLLRYANPEAGTWWVSTRGSNPDVAPDLVTGYVKNPRARCFAGASRRITDRSNPLSIAATAYYDNVPVIEGASVSATLLRPDKIEAPLTFEYDETAKVHMARIPPEQLVGRGKYSVNVVCHVEEGAVQDPGESLPGKEGAPGPAGGVVAFTRHVGADFFYDVPEQAPLPGTSIPVGDEIDRSDVFVDDCDLDGIPNSAEVDADTDGDGTFDVCDSDADNDDIPDSVDPDPTVDAG